MMSDIDRAYLVTGAASGIGRATAVAAAREGAQLFLTDINAAGLEQVAGEIRASGGRVGLAKALDISSIDAVRTLALEIHAAHGSLDVLMNIAGISIWGPVENLTHEHWRRCVDVNLMGPIHVLECFLPPMIAAKRGGHVVNVSSAAGLFQFVEQTWLSTLKQHGSKHGYARYSELITKGQDGRYHVNGAEARRAVMDLRLDPHASSLMAGELASDHAAYLKGRVVRDPTAGELYAAHFLGP